MPSTSASRPGAPLPPRCLINARTRAASWAAVEAAPAALGCGSSCRAGGGPGAAPTAAARRHRRSVQAAGATLRVCIASTAPQIASQNGRCPWIAYIATAVMMKPEKCPATPRSRRTRAASRGSPEMGTSRR